MPEPPRRGTFAGDSFLREWAEQTNKSLEDLTRTVQFLLEMDDRTLRILVRQAHLLERIANIVYRIVDPDQLSPEQVEERFAEIRKLFDEQRAIMAKRADG